jgi:hypothetical protein
MLSRRNVKGMGVEDAFFWAGAFPVDKFVLHVYAIRVASSSELTKKERTNVLITVKL